MINKKVENLEALFQNRNDFKKDSESNNIVIKDNSQLKKDLLNLDNLLKLTDKKIYIYHSGNNFNLKNNYSLKNINKDQTDPSFEPDAINFIKFLIDETNVKFEEVKNFVLTNDDKTKSILNTKIKTNIEKKLQKIFNTFFKEELNSELSIDLQDTIISIRIKPKKRFLI